MSFLLLGCLLLDRVLEEDVVLLIRTEFRTISGSPMNAVGVNQDVLSAWGT